MTLLDRAMAFFSACETGRGWAGCARYCQPEAGFSGQARALDGITTLAAYTDWMAMMCKSIPDPAYRILGAAADEERGMVLVQGVFSGTLAPVGAAPGRRFDTDYVYALRFDGPLIAHLTKIWNDGYE